MVCSNLSLAAFPSSFPFSSPFLLLFSFPLIPFSFPPLPSPSSIFSSSFHPLPLSSSFFPPSQPISSLPFLPLSFPPFCSFPYHNVPYLPIFSPSLPYPHPPKVKVSDVAILPVLQRLWLQNRQSDYSFCLSVALRSSTSWKTATYVAFVCHEASREHCQT